jgi:hypothetical protein
MRSRQVDTVLILSENEIKKATDNFSEDNVLGCGGHGMVYRGTLDDNKEVAIKKSKLKDDDSREEFVNEIIILSQINHRNIVRLLGGCTRCHRRRLAEASRRPTTALVPRAGDFFLSRSRVM